MNRGIASFTLDYGTCPKWLFERMVKLGREMTYVLIDEFGEDEFVKRIADPVWFQSLGTVLAFDWNASGLTTILTAALKEAIRGRERELGIVICGGKGKTSRKTPDEIVSWGNQLNFSTHKTSELVYSSKMAAKVDSSLVQDGYQIYHHAFFFSRNGSWAVVQQGMNTGNQSARRYHWYDSLDNYSSSDPEHVEGESRSFKDDSSRQSSNNNKFDFVNEPHAAISSQGFQDHMLNMVSKKSAKTRDVSSELVQQNYESLMKDIQILRKYSSNLSKMISLKSGDEQLTLLKLEDEHFTTHPVVSEDFSKSKYLEKILQKLTYYQPGTYENLLATQGVGPKTIRALSLVSEVIYGAKPSYEDPARYSFAHGGKDEIPYPVDLKTYDNTVEILKHVVSKTHLSPTEKDKATMRLNAAGEKV